MRSGHETSPHVTRKNKNKKSKNSRGSGWFTDGCVRLCVCARVKRRRSSFRTELMSPPLLPAYLIRTQLSVTFYYYNPLVYSLTSCSSNSGGFSASSPNWRSCRVPLRKTRGASSRESGRIVFRSGVATSSVCVELCRPLRVSYFLFPAMYPAVRKTFFTDCRCAGDAPQTFEELFAKLDTNKDGKVDVSELREGLAAMGIQTGTGGIQVERGEKKEVIYVGEVQLGEKI